MIHKNATVVGVERIEGKSKKTNKEFGFWKLHVTVPVPAAAGFGQKCLGLNINDDVFTEEQFQLDDTLMIFEKYGNCEFIQKL